MGTGCFKRVTYKQFCVSLNTYCWVKFLTISVTSSTTQEKALKRLLTHIIRVQVEWKVIFLQSVQLIDPKRVHDLICLILRQILIRHNVYQNKISIIFLLKVLIFLLVKI